MRGLAEINKLNDLEAAKFLKKRYEKLRARAEHRSDWRRAARYDRQATEFDKFIRGIITIFPRGRNKRRTDEAQSSRHA